MSLIRHKETSSEHSGDALCATSNRGPFQGLSLRVSLSLIQVFLRSGTTTMMIRYRNAAMPNSESDRTPRMYMATIALVDDDRDVLDVVATMLEAAGYQVVAYSDGPSALNGLKALQPDLAILDIKMPQMDGV